MVDYTAVVQNVRDTRDIINELYAIALEGRAGGFKSSSNAVADKEFTVSEKKDIDDTFKAKEAEAIAALGDLEKPLPPQL